MIKIFIGHFNCLPDNPYVFAGDLAQVGEGGVRVLREVDSGLGRTGGGASGVGRLPDSVVLGGSGGLGGAEFPRSELERMFRDPCPAGGGSTCLPRAFP